MDYKNIKIRIVRKQKDGITLRVKGNEIKFPWDEFNEGYIIVDSVYAMMNEQLVERMSKLDELIKSATTSYFIMQNSVPGFSKLTHAAVLSETIGKIQKLLNCNGLEAIQLIKKQVDSMNNMFNSEKTVHTREYYRKQKLNKNRDKFPKRVETPVNSTSCVLEDNPILQKLKNELKS